MRNLSYEDEFCMQFHSHANQSHFHKNGFALRLALKQRHKGTRKWPISLFIRNFGLQTRLPATVDRVMMLQIKYKKSNDVARKAMLAESNFSLALINRAEGLYGGVLTQVVSTDRTQSWQ